MVTDFDHPINGSPSQKIKSTFIDELKRKNLSVIQKF